MEHYCRWLDKRKCWQKGKRIKKSECSPCLCASGFATIAGFASHLKKSPSK